MNKTNLINILVVLSVMANISFAKEQSLAGYTNEVTIDDIGQATDYLIKDMVKVKKALKRIIKQQDTFYIEVNQKLEALSQGQMRGLNEQKEIYDSGNLNSKSTQERIKKLNRAVLMLSQKSKESSSDLYAEIQRLTSKLDDMNKKDEFENKSIKADMDKLSRTVDNLIKHQSANDETVQNMLVKVDTKLSGIKTDSSLIKDLKKDQKELGELIAQVGTMDTSKLEKRVDDLNAKIDKLAQNSGDSSEKVNKKMMLKLQLLESKLEDISSNGSSSNSNDKEIQKEIKLLSNQVTQLSQKVNKLKFSGGNGTSNGKVSPQLLSKLDTLATQMSKLRNLYRHTLFVANQHLDGYEFVITSKYANVRSMPNLKAKVVNRVRYGQALKILNIVELEESTWIETKYGYVSSVTGFMRNTNKKMK
jgi:myosin heavy subunit